MSRKRNLSPKMINPGFWFLNSLVFERAHKYLTKKKKQRVFLCLYLFSLYTIFRSRRGDSKKGLSVSLLNMHLDLFRCHSSTCKQKRLKTRSLFRHYLIALNEWKQSHWNCDYLRSVHYEGWERNSSKCFFTYVYIDLFRFHPLIYFYVWKTWLPPWANISSCWLLIHSNLSGMGLIPRRCFGSLLLRKGVYSTVVLETTCLHNWNTDEKGIK